MDTKRIARAIRSLRASVSPCTSLTLETRTATDYRYTFLTLGTGGIRKLREVEVQPGARYFIHAISQKRRCSSQIEITQWLTNTPPLHGRLT